MDINTLAEQTSEAPFRSIEFRHKNGIVQVLEKLGSAASDEMAALKLLRNCSLFDPGFVQQLRTDDGLPVLARTLNAGSATSESQLLCVSILSLCLWRDPSCATELLRLSIIPKLTALLETPMPAMVIETCRCLHYLVSGQRTKYRLFALLISAISYVASACAEVGSHGGIRELVRYLELSDRDAQKECATVLAACCAADKTCASIASQCEVFTGVVALLASGDRDVNTYGAAIVASVLYHVNAPQTITALLQTDCLRLLIRHMKLGIRNIQRNVTAIIALAASEDEQVRKIAGECGAVRLLCDVVHLHDEDAAVALRALLALRALCVDDANATLFLEQRRTLEFVQRMASARAVESGVQQAATELLQALKSHVTL
eukprot:TRINITY_DN1460_c0_g1_i1.p1 TRINITY_DN1460_c0_g1~~TRINITY_DN1460_c0_g1_i1.p1  ORF type:complete len:376 (-),score=54.14 TRINITY_DN1460_c0_g1_i1:83-1210(-)